MTKQTETERIERLLRSAVTDPVTGEHLYYDARADLYVEDVVCIEKYIKRLAADLVPRWSSDMDAAPKDGTLILTFHPANPDAYIERARRGNWVINEWRGAGWYRSLPEQPPIAWMFLPAPPKGET